jgi:hypothetical protein
MICRRALQLSPLISGELFNLLPVNCVCKIIRQRLRQATGAAIAFALRLAKKTDRIHRLAKVNLIQNFSCIIIYETPLCRCSGQTNQMALLYKRQAHRQHKKGKHNYIKKGKIVSDRLSHFLKDIAVQNLGC